MIISKLKFYSWHNVVFFLVAFLFMRFYIIEKVILFPQVIPDALIFYSSKDLHEIIINYTTTDIYYYKNASIKVDILYPIIYSTLFFLLISFALRFSKIKKKYLCSVRFIPYLAAIFDLIENAILIDMLNKLPAFNYQTATIVSFISATKWIIVFLSIIIFILFLINSLFFKK